MLDGLLVLHPLCRRFRQKKALYPRFPFQPGHTISDPNEVFLVVLPVVKGPQEQKCAEALRADRYGGLGIPDGLSAKGTPGLGFVRCGVCQPTGNCEIYPKVVLMEYLRHPEQ